MTAISDLVSDVAFGLGNRTDLTSGSPSKVAGYVQKAYVDLGSSYRFELLQVTKENLVFSENEDTYAYPADARAINAITAQDANGNALPVRKKDIHTIRRFGTNPGPPSIYAPYGTNFIIRSIPDQEYTYTLDYWQIPQITQDVVSTVLLVPTDWVLIVQYLATMIGHIALLERDKAGELHKLLYGDPVHPDMPGLIKERLLRWAAENVDSDYAIRPVIKSYT